MPFAFGYIEGIHLYGDVGLQWRWPHHQPSTMSSFFQKSFKCPWQGKRDTGRGEEGLALSPTTSAEHSTVSWPNCNSKCSTRPTTLGMGGERSPQSMADTSSSLWDTRGVIASSRGRGGKPGLLTDGSSSGSHWEQPHKRGNLFHSVCLEADSTSKTSAPATSWAALPCSTCRQNCTALPQTLGSAHTFASALKPFPVAHPLHLLLNSHASHYPWGWESRVPGFLPWFFL